MRPTCKPNSVIPFLRDRWPFIWTSSREEVLAIYLPFCADHTWLLDLAPGGVYLAAAVSSRTGGLLHRRFTLAHILRAVCFLLHLPFPEVQEPSVLEAPCPAEFGLSFPVETGTTIRLASVISCNPRIPTAGF